MDISKIISQNKSYTARLFWGISSHLLFLSQLYVICHLPPLFCPQTFFHHDIDIVSSFVPLLNHLKKLSKHTLTQKLVWRIADSLCVLFEWHSVDVGKEDSSQVCYKINFCPFVSKRKTSVCSTYWMEFDSTQHVLQQPMQTDICQFRYWIIFET